jgi:DNA-binding MarR family transcriptional regulator
VVSEPQTHQSLFSDSEYKDQADFRCAFRVFLRYAEEQSRAAGITPQQYFLLLVVRGHEHYPRVNIGEIAEALQVRHHGASLLVDRCVRRGLLGRAEDPEDRRRVHVWLTEEGQELLDRIMDANRKKLGALHEALFRDSLQRALVHYQELEQASPDGVKSAAGDASRI